MLELIGLGITAGAVIAGFTEARRFVASRLRFVDGAHRRSTPWMVGAIAAVAAAPIVWLVPLIGGGTALLFGAAVGMGVASGSRQVRAGLYQLPPA